MKTCHGFDFVGAQSAVLTVCATDVKSHALLAKGDWLMVCSLPRLHDWVRSCYFELCFKLGNFLIQLFLSSTLFNCGPVVRGHRADTFFTR